MKGYLSLKEKYSNFFLRYSAPRSSKKSHKYKKNGHRAQARTFNATQASMLAAEPILRPEDASLQAMQKEKQKEEYRQTQEELLEERLRTAKAVPVTDSLFDTQSHKSLEEYVV